MPVCHSRSYIEIIYFVIVFRADKEWVPPENLIA
jgi:hypothetical protein